MQWAINFPPSFSVPQFVGFSDHNNSLTILKTEKYQISFLMKNGVDVRPPAGKIYPLTTPATRHRQDSGRLPTFTQLLRRLNCPIATKI